MSGTCASELLRDGLLEGTGVLLAGAWAPGQPEDGSFASAVHGALSGLGAGVLACPAPGGGELRAAGGAGAGGPTEEELDAQVDAAVRQLGSVGLLAVDAAGLFAASRAAGEEEGEREEEAGRRAMLECMRRSWSVTRAVANRAFISGARPGRIVYLAPRPEGGRLHAEAVRAGLENLARTLSIEWSRHAITPVTIAPGNATRASEVAALLAYLASPAGAYFSGCVLDLRGPAQGP